MLAFDSILFDFDGVLADTEPLHWLCWREVLKPLGIDLDWDYYAENCVGIDDRGMLQVMAEKSDPPRDWHDLFAQYPRKKELFSARTHASPPFVPELGPMLEELHGAYRLAVVTSSGRAEVEPLLVAGGLRRHFDAIVGAENVTRRKPEPEPYLKAAELVGGRSPLVVEDSVPGIASGRAAGFEVLEIPDAAHMPALLRARLAAAAPGRITGSDGAAMQCKLE